MPPEELPRPRAVLLDVGGVFLLPDPRAIRHGFELAGFDVDVERLDLAHYHGATALSADHDHDAAFPLFWDDYLFAYCRAVDVPDALLPDAIEHLRAAFSTMAAWNKVAPHSRDGLRLLVDTGVPVGIISNADGTVAQILRELEVLQVGPGPGVPVRCIIDSGEVGVEKPDPAIFRIGLDALGARAEQTWYVGDTPSIDVVGARRAGLTPIVLDPYGVNREPSFAVAESVAQIAGWVEEISARQS